MRKKPTREIVIEGRGVTIFSYFPGRLYINTFTASKSSIERLCSVLNVARRKPSTRIDIYPNPDYPGFMVCYSITQRVYINFVQKGK
jgi:hypothetical protein